MKFTMKSMILMLVLGVAVVGCARKQQQPASNLKSLDQAKTEYVDTSAKPTAYRSSTAPYSK